MKKMGLYNFLWLCRGRTPVRPANNNMHPSILRDAQGRAPYSHTNLVIPKRIILMAIMLFLVFLVACSVEKAPELEFKLDEMDEAQEREEREETEEEIIIITEGPQWITATQAKEIISNQETIIIDVRTPAEFNSGHIKGAISMPLDEITTIAPTLIKDQTILVYCRSGNRSFFASWILFDMGYNMVYDFGGIISWYGEISIP